MIKFFLFYYIKFITQNYFNYIFKKIQPNYFLLYQILLILDFTVNHQFIFLYYVDDYDYDHDYENGK
jgi:hypothetical protein